MLEISSLEECGFYLLLHFLNSGCCNDKENRIVSDLGQKG